MQIVHLLTYLDNQTGGMERQALQLAVKLRERGCHVFFVTCAYRDWMRQQGFGFVGALQGFTIYRIPLLRGWYWCNAFLYAVGAFIVLFLLRRRYTIIHAHQLYTSGVIACIVKLFLPTKKVIIKNPAGGMYGDVQHIRRSFFASCITYLLRHVADRCIALSHETDEEMEKLSLPRRLVIPNGVDTTVFSPLSYDARENLRRRMLGTNAVKGIILFVGRLGSEKNVSFLLDAVIALSAPFFLLIVGDGVLRKELEQQVYAQRLHDRVHFYGAIASPLHLYQIADIFVLPSRSEGMPNTLLEAMSCGLPSIATDLPSTRSVIRHDDNGYLFPVSDSVALRRLITTIFSDSSITGRIGERARSSIEARFNVDAIADAYVNLYTSLI